MKKSTLALLVCAALPFAASAKEFKIPNDDFGIASINIPDSWEPEEVNNGVAGNSPDKAVFISAVAVGSEKGMNAELEDTFAMLKEHSVQLDDSTKKENKFKLGKLDADELLYQGKDEDGPTAVSICFVPIKDKLLVLTYWVTTAEEAKHSSEVGKIVNSIKPL